MSGLSISLLGPLIVTLDGRPITSFEYKKVRALLAHIAVENECPLRREALAGLLWPDQSQKAALNGLRNALSKLRHAIGDKNANPPYLLITNETIHFNPSSDHWLDVKHFHRLLAACRTHRHSRIECCQSCSDRLTQVVKLYRGEFLEGFYLADSDLFNDWVAIKREKLSKMVIEALKQLSLICERRGELDQALKHSSHQLELDPLEEDTYTQVMKQLAASGQVAEACRQYTKCREILKKELGVEPSDETTHLYEQIKYGTFQVIQQIDKRRIDNLPGSLTSFIGREREVTEISLLLDNPDCRLLTLVGLGGVGKTRLALAVGERQTKTFLNGVCFVPLASTNSTGLISSAILQALNLRAAEHSDPKEQLIEFLQNKELLLVLDNFEHLVEGAGLVTEILHRTQGVKVMVTSRQHLDLQVEWLYEVSGLSFPPIKAMQNLECYEAVQLFTQRLHQVKPFMILYQDDLSSISSICQLVEGLPLGIELAAAAVRQQPIEQIATVIGRDKEALVASWRDVPERHRSLRAVFDHSWRLLTDQQRSVFSGLAIFRGGFTAEAAQQVAGGMDPVLNSLVQQSLVRFYPKKERYDLHDIVRQYALEKARTQGIEHDLYQRHLNYYIDLAERIYTTYHKSLLWEDLTGLTPEMANCRAALEWSFTSNQTDLALQMTGALGDYWLHYGHGQEAENWITKLLNLKYAFKNDHYLARVLLVAGFIIKNRDMETGRSYLEQALSIWKALGDEGNVAVVLLNLYYIHLMQGEHETAIGMLEQALAIFQHQDNQKEIAATLNDLADVYLILDTKPDLDKALLLSEQALAIDRRIGHTSAIHWDLRSLGNIELRRGNFSQARALFEEAAAQLKGRENIIELSEIYGSLGTACYYLGDYQSARSYYEQRLEITLTNQFGFRDISILCKLCYLISRQGVHDQALFHFKEIYRQLDTGGDTYRAVKNGFLELLPGVVLACGEPERAARLYGFADTLREKQKASMPNYIRPDFERDLAETRLQLGDAAFARAWAEGCLMSLEQARVCALEAKVRLATSSGSKKPVLP